MLERLAGDPSGTDDLVTYLNKSNCFPVYANTEVTFFPLGEEKFAAMLRELEKAEKFIFMEYFIIEEGFMWGSVLELLVEKAKAGVDVRVMYDGMLEISTLPPNYCKLLQQKGIQAKAHYKRLVEAGVKIYEYAPGFVHAKVFVSDDRKAVVGTINLDYRSLYHHFGCATYMYRTACIPDIERDFQETLEKCRRVTPESIQQEKLSYKIVGQLAQFIAPLM